MMTATLVEPSTGEYLVRTEGHAETPEVCAAASCIMQMLQAWMHTSGVIVKEDRADEGDCEMRFKGLDACDKLRCHTAYEMTAVGFLRLHSTAPNEIRVIISGNRSDT